jgi:hypothetical protein
MTFLRPLAAALGVTLLTATACLHAAEPGETRVAKWKDDKKGVFLVMFDVGWPSQVLVGVPALQERGLIGTFYVIPEKGEFTMYIDNWQTDALGSGQVFGNQTMTGKGVHDAVEAEYEIGGGAAAIRGMTNAPEHKLLSFVRPGVTPGNWELAWPEFQELLKKFNLIERPNSKGHGAVYELKDVGAMLSLADKASAAGGMEFVVIQGIERPGNEYQDSNALPQETLFALLDGLKERRDRGELWITDHISYLQYEKERATAAATPVFVKPEGMRLELKSEADPKQYDLPLTLVTTVPPDWKGADVLTGGKVTKVPARNGEIMFDAAPNSGFIDIRPAR